MSVFNEFCEAWKQKFPGEDIPGAWEEDIRTNLGKHKEKVNQLKKQLEKEEFYVKFLENVLVEAESRKQNIQSLLEYEWSSSDSVGTSTEARKTDFVTVISVNSKQEEGLTGALNKVPNQDKPTPPKRPPKQYLRSTSADISSIPQQEDLVAWTKHQIQQLHTKQLTKTVEPPNQNQEKSVNYENVQVRQRRISYENAIGRKPDYENVFNSFNRSLKSKSEGGKKTTKHLLVTNLDADDPKLRPEECFQPQRSKRVPVTRIPPLQKHDSVDDPLYDSVPHEDFHSDGDYVDLAEEEGSEKEAEMCQVKQIASQRNGTLHSQSSTDNSSMGSLSCLYANISSLDDGDSPKCPSTKLQLVLQSFADAEEAYVDVLNIIGQYNKLLKATLGSSQPFITEDEINAIFYHVSALHTQHSDFLQQLKKAKTTEWDVLQVSNALQELSTNVLPEYGFFLNNYKTALDTTRRVAENSPQFAQLTRRVKGRNRDPQQNTNYSQSMVLEDLLHKPVARIQHHVGVIKDLLECVHPDDAAYTFLQKAQQLTKTFLSEFSAHQLQSLFPSQSNKRNHIPLNRHLVKNGFLVELQQDGKRKQRHCFLFTDFIVCMKYKNTSGTTANLEVKWHLPLALIDVTTDEPANKLNVSALTNVASLRSQAAFVRTEMQRCAVGADKQRKKLASLEAKLLLDSPNLPLKFVMKPKNAGSKSTSHYTFLLSSEYERSQWVEAVRALQRNAATSRQSFNLQWEEVEGYVKAHKDDVEPQLSHSKKNLIPAIGGEIQVVIHSLKGLHKPADIYVVLELDSYGHFFHTARTKMIVQTIEPLWEEDFNLDLEGSRGLRVLVYEQDPQHAAVLRGKAEVELTVQWLNSLHGPQRISLTSQGSVTSMKANKSRDEDLSLTMTLRYLSRDLTLRRVPRRSAAVGIFGVPIEEVCQREKRPIPYIISCCAREVERRGLEELGIYRVSGLATDIAKLRKAFDTRGIESDSFLRDVDINSVSGLLKLYLRQLPEALFTDKLYSSFLQAFSTLDSTSSLGGDDLSVEGGARTLIQLFSSLPKVNQNVIVYILEHLVRVNNMEVKNKMSLHNLATVFGPTLLRPAVTSNGADGRDNDLLAISTVDVMAQAGILHFFLSRRARSVPIQFPSS